MGCVVFVFLLEKKKEKKKGYIYIYMLLMKYTLYEKYLHENSQSNY